MRNLPRLLSGCLLSGLLPFCAGASDTGPLTMYYFERPPLYYSDQGRIAGLFAEPVNVAAERAGITLRWEALTASRLFVQLKENREVFCSPGWAKTEKRRQWAQFSVPYMPPAKVIVLTRSALVPELKRIGSLHKLLARRDLSLGQRENFSFGPSIDALIEKYDTPMHLHRIVSPEQALQLLASGRIDYTFGQQAVLDYLKARNPELLAGLDSLSYPDMPEDEPFYLMCTLKTPKPLLERLNAALADGYRPSR